MSQEEKDGWREWSKHILSALERLDKQLDTVRNDINKANLDIAKLGYLSTSLMEVENKLARIREDITTQSENFKAAVSSLEDDDTSNLKGLEEKMNTLSSRVSNLEFFATRTKTIGWIIGTALAALIGMLSFSLSDLFK
jgi:DNA repair exonuclease SbcCD ATPase subunit